MPLTAKQIRSNDQLSKDGLDADAIKDFRATEQRYYAMLVELDDANAKKDYDAATRLEYSIARTEFRLSYQGRNPKEIPIAELREHVGSVESWDGVIQTYARKVSNPATAVRAFCMRCTGGQQAEIRRCQATSCPLWPVRIGKNPFYGKTMPPTMDLPKIELEDDADAALVEDDDNVEAKE